MKRCLAKPLDEVLERWKNIGGPWNRKYSDWVEYCPHHGFVGFAGYHVRTENGVRIFECGTCGCEFRQDEGIEVDPR